jgi:TonB family protein
MNKLFAAGVIATTVVIGAMAQKTSISADTSSATNPLIQVEQLTGDQIVGFSESCLLLYSNGKYHREIRRQEETNGHPSGIWQSPEVFEGSIDDVQTVEDLIESPSFRSIAGTLGDPQIVRSRLLFMPLGVVPHADIDIFEASIAHSDHPQVFEVFKGYGAREPDSLTLFKKWIAKIEKRKDKKMDRDEANSCAAYSSGAKGSPWFPATSLIPRPLYVPAPGRTGEQPEQSGTAVIQVLVNADGTVGRASVRHSTNPEMNGHVLETIKKWRFFPAQINGIAIASSVNVQLNFPSN